MSQSIEKKFDEFVSSHPRGTYEEWISTLHPEAKEKCLLEGLGGEILIDPEYYAEDNEHRKLWNAHLDSKRTMVPATPTSSDNSENHDSAIITDLLGDGEAMVSPAGSPSQKASVEKDLLSFD